MLTLFYALTYMQQTHGIKIKKEYMTIFVVLLRQVFIGPKKCTNI